MTPRERVIKSLAFQEPEIVPYTLTFTNPAKNRMIEYYGDPDFEDKIGNHIARFSHRKHARWDEIKPGHMRDEWGVIWNRTIDTDIGVVENLVIPEPSIVDLKIPEVTQKLIDSYPEFVQKNHDRFRMTSIGFAIFERAWSLRGMEQVLTDMIDNPEFVHKLLNAILEANMANLDVALKQDIDCVFFGDDWGSQSGLIMGPGLWREFIKPITAKMYGRVRDAGKYVAIHSCGDVKMILPDLVEIGLNLFNPFQPETMDIFETKKKYYGSLAFYGGISVQNLLPHGTTEQVRSETSYLLQELGKGGGYVASPSHDIPSDVPAENIAALIETLNNQ